MTTVSISLPFQRTNSIALKKVSWKLIYAVLVGLCVVLTISYVYSVSKLTEGTFTIKKYTETAATLADENKNLETQFAESDFLQSMQTKAQALNFEKTAQVNYVQLWGNSLADAKQRP